MPRPRNEHGAVALLRETIARQRAALEAVLPVLERGNASYRSMQIRRKDVGDCPTLGPLVIQVKGALAGGRA